MPGGRPQSPKRDGTGRIAVKKEGRENSPFCIGKKGGSCHSDVITAHAPMLHSTRTCMRAWQQHGCTQAHAPPDGSVTAHSCMHASHLTEAAEHSIDAECRRLEVQLTQLEAPA